MMMVWRALRAPVHVGRHRFRPLAIDADDAAAQRVAAQEITITLGH
jgi:hypothetical protein